jgi:Family of unknown function (DUF6459)
VAVTVEVTPRDPKPALRLRPVPQSEPPFDDERDPRPWAFPPRLAPDWSVPPTSPRRTAAGAGGTVQAAGAAGAPAPTGPGDSVDAGATATATHTGPTPTSRDGRRAAPPRRARGGAGSPDQTGRDRRTGSGAQDAGPTAPGPLWSALPAGTPGHRAAPRLHPGAPGDARLAVRRFVGACVEVLNGYRPAAHLRRLALPGEAARVVAQGVAGAHRVADLRHAASRARRGAPVAVLRLRVCEPRPGAAEASVVLVTGERSWAMALRLELHDGSWLATTLRLI